MSQFVSENECELTCPKAFADNLDKELPLLLASFKGNNSSHVVKFLFGKDSVLNHISNYELENKLLKPALLSLSNIFSKNLSRTLNILESAEDSDEEICFTLSEILQVCLDILDGYNDLLAHFLNYSLLKSSEVGSLILTLPQVLLEAFNYCHGSENSYGSYFALSSDLLTTFFRKSYEVTTLFYKILDEHIHFDCSAEKDVTLLVTALETLCSLGEIVVNLDVKSLVDQWKAIYKLITKYSNNLKDRFDISKPLKFLMLHLKKTISCICDEQEENHEQIRTRNLKLGSFILKIIVKLCELYCGFLDTSINDLLDLLILLNRCSRLSRKNYNDELERFIVVGAGPLLSNLIQDRQFLEVFKQYCDNYGEKTIEEIIGLFFTHLRLLKLLINCNNSEVKENCRRIPLVQSVIKLFSRSCKYLDLTTRLEDVDTYTSLISVSVAYVISSFTSENFVSLEQFILGQIFKADIEMGLLCSDILTLLCRLTNEEVCLKITRYIFHALSLLESTISRPEVVLVRITAGRLYSLLSRSGQEAIENEFPVPSHAWRHIHVQSTDKLVPITQSFETSTPLEFANKIECLHIVCSSGFNSTIEKGQISETVRRLLIGLKTCSKISDEQADGWYQLFYLLMRCLVYISPRLDSSRIDEVLDLFLDLVYLGQQPINYYVCSALTNIIKHEGLLVNPSCYLSKATNIFQLSFVCENIAIKQIAVDKFVSINSFNKEKILKEIDQGSREFIIAYMKKVTLTHSKTNFYSFDINFKHKCHTCDYNMEYSPPNKKFKQDTDHIKTSDMIIQLKGCVDNVLLYAKKNPLTLEEKQIIHSLICNLENL